MAVPISLVLSSGGARGIAHIGAIETLKNEGYIIESVAGCSIGSLMGGLYAMGRLDDFKQWLLTLRKRDIFNLMDFTWSTSGVMKGEKVFNKIKSFIPDMLIEDMPIPFTAVSTDIIHQKEITFTTGSFFDAARASIAMPGIFTPVNYMENVLVDGGLVNPLPINHLKRNKNSLLVAVNLNASEEDLSSLEHTTQKYGGYFAISQMTILTMLNKITELSISLYRPDIVINVPAAVAGIWDYHKAAYLLEVGKEKTSSALDYYRQKQKQKNFFRTFLKH